jgi:ABC-type lipoprotein export system ATPase subunit
MNRNVFEIQNLECAYDRKGRSEKKVILCIEDLSIPMGKVSIILGLSGSGKSTLIETLGLMNNTITKGSITYYHAGNKIGISQKTWEHPSALTKMRNRHFSFIFQNDFLMPCFSSEENMLIGRMIQGSGGRFMAEREKMKQLCRKIGLNFEELSAQKPSEMSVGQRQRISFIRAILKDYSVIFGDEPTGNLDEANSELLMDVLCESVKQNEQCSAVLVSHNIALSVAKADCIIVLTPKPGEQHEVLPGNVFTRSETGWLNRLQEFFPDDKLESAIREVVKIRESDC